MFSYDNVVLQWPIDMIYVLLQQQEIPILQIQELVHVGKGDIWQHQGGQEPDTLPCPIFLAGLNLRAPHWIHHSLHPVDVGIGTDCARIPPLILPLHLKHNSSDVARAISFLHPEVHHILPHILFHSLNMAQAAIVIGALCQAQVHAGQDD